MIQDPEENSKKKNKNKIYTA